MTTRIKKIIVNGLSSSRIIGAFFLPIVFSKVSIPLLIVFLTFLFITDFFDGFLARRWKIQTLGGSLLDPIGDKVLALLCICSLMNVHKKLILLLVLESAIALLNLIRFASGDKVKLAIVGKVKTWILSITLILASINHFNPSFIDDILNIVGIESKVFTIQKSTIDISLYITFGMELATLIVYLSDAIKNYQNRKSRFSKKIDIKKFIIRAFDESKYSEDKEKSFVEIINSME